MMIWMLPQREQRRNKTKGKKIKEKTYKIMRDTTTLEFKDPGKVLFDLFIFAPFYCRMYSSFVLFSF